MCVKHVDYLPDAQNFGRLDEKWLDEIERVEGMVVESMGGGKKFESWIFAE